MVVGGVGGPETENVGACNGLMCRAEDVSNDSAYAGVGSTKWLDGRRVIVGLALECIRAAGRELHDACVAVECRDHKAGIDLVGRAPKLIEQGLEDRAIGQHDVGPKALVRAVLAPGLGERFEFGVGWQTVRCAEVVADHVQFGEVKGKPALRAEPTECVVVERKVDQLGGRHGGLAQCVAGLDVDSSGPPLDDGIGVVAADLAVVERLIEIDEPANGGIGDVNTEQRSSVDDLLSGGIGDSGDEADIELQRADWRVPRARFEQRIAQHRLQALAVEVAQRALDGDRGGQRWRVVRTKGKAVAIAGRSVTMSHALTLGEMLRMAYFGERKINAGQICGVISRRSKVISSTNSVSTATPKPLPVGTVIWPLARSKDAVISRCQ